VSLIPTSVCLAIRISLGPENSVIGWRRLLLLPRQKLKPVASILLTLNLSRAQPIPVPSQRWWESVAA